MAVPSTTSMTTQPAILSNFSALVRTSATLPQTDPPSECPTNIIFLSANLPIISFRVSIVSEHNDSIDKSRLLLYFLEKPCPLKSKAITVPKCLTSLASRAKLSADCPAP